MAILNMGSVPGARAEIGHFASGLVLHSIAYGGLTLLLFTGTTGTPRERAIKAVLTVFAMGAIDELVQSFLPYRVGSLVDLTVDSGAALVVATLLWAYLPEPAPN
jgi:VanZ family protein